eukprot:UN08184
MSQGKVVVIMVVGSSSSSSSGVRGNIVALSAGLLEIITKCYQTIFTQPLDINTTQLGVSLADVFEEQPLPVQQQNSTGNMSTSSSNNYNNFSILRPPKRFKFPSLFSESQRKASTSCQHLASINVLQSFAVFFPPLYILTGTTDIQHYNIQKTPLSLWKNQLISTSFDQIPNILA